MGGGSTSSNCSLFPASTKGHRNFSEGTPNNQDPRVTAHEPTVLSMGLSLPPRLVPLL